MFFLSFIAAFAASILSLTAYLQAESAWWKGPLASVVLFILGYTVSMLMPMHGLKEPIYPPSLIPWYTAGFVTWLAALMCSALVGIGALAGLVLRIFWTPGQFAWIVFVVGWFVIFFTILE
jgi:hypothetical protein